MSTGRLKIIIQYKNHIILYIKRLPTLPLIKSLKIKKSKMSFNPRSPFKRRILATLDKFNLPNIIWVVNEWFWWRERLLSRINVGQLLIVGAEPGDTRGMSERKLLWWPHAIQKIKCCLLCYRPSRPWRLKASLISIVVT